MPQTGRTQTEQWFLSEQLRSEELSLKKASIYAKQTDDPKLRTMCERFRDLHEKNVRILSSLAGEGNAGAGAGMTGGRAEFGGPAAFGGGGVEGAGTRRL
ncbi:MAG: hypothetical protein HPY55_01985 [Firmicutes bacterium]|nr:hypothetical protein [Bacillota bacterium]